jgi:outer membrane protein assembly factor BamB
MLGASRALAADPSSGWPQFRHDPVHSGENPAELGLGVANVAQLSPYWRFGTGDFLWSSPAVSDGVLYVGTFDGYLYALSATTSRRLWQLGPVQGIWSSPAVVGGVVYVGADDGRLYALQASTGTKLWSFKAAARIDSSPTVVGGVVYVGAANGTIYAIDAARGAQLWSHEAGDFVFSSPAVAGGVVYIGADTIDDQPAPHPGALYALDAATGQELWRHDLTREVDSSPTVANGLVFVGCFDGSVYALDAATGATAWSYMTGGSVWSSPAVAGGVVYVGSQDASVYALDASTGAKLWSAPTGGPVDSSPAVANGVVYVGSTDPLGDDLIALDAATGDKLWGYRSGDTRGIESSPAIVDGVVYVGTMGSFFDRGPFRVLAFRPAQPLTISSSASVVGYRGSVSLTVHLGLADATNRAVRIYRMVNGGARILVAAADLDTQGTAVVKASSLAVTDGFVATWSGDATHAALSSNAAYVGVRAKATGVLSRFYGVSHGYRLYHFSTDPRRSPAFTASVSPNHSGGHVVFRLQRHTSAGWRTVAVSGEYRLNDASKARAVWIAPGPSVIGAPMRIRAEWLGDPRNASSSSSWHYFKMTS